MTINQHIYWPAEPEPERAQRMVRESRTLIELTREHVAQTRLLLNRRRAKALADKAAPPKARG